jgi:hypothetical protein
MLKPITGRNFILENYTQLITEFVVHINAEVFVKNLYFIQTIKLYSIKQKKTLIIVMID